MSDYPEGDDWWQATDGRWYPPEVHPDAVADADAEAKSSGLSGTAIAALVGVVAALVIGAIYWATSGGEDPPNQTVTTEDGSPDDSADGTGADPDDRPTPDSGGADATDDAGEEAAELTGFGLGENGLGVVAFGATTGDVIEAMTAELGPATFDSRWKILDHANPDGEGFANAATNPTVTFDFPQYRHLCWGDVVMLCTIHGRFEAPGTFLGWEQAHRGAAAHSDALTIAPELGATTAGIAVGSTAAELVESGQGELRAGPGGMLLFDGTFRGRLGGEWPAGSPRPEAADQPIQCIEAGGRLRPTMRATCALAIADTTPVNALARTLLDAAIAGSDIPFVATHVPNGPTAESGFSAFDGAGLIADLAPLSVIEEPYDIRGAGDLVPDADPVFGGNSCSFPGDVTVQCTYRIVHPDGIETVVLSYQATGFVSATIS